MMFNLPNREENTSIFYCFSGAFNGLRDYQFWRKPKNINMVMFFLLGGGGGGGGGRSSISNSSYGGGGGASSGFSIGLFQACLLPDLLYVQVGCGGLGASATAAATNGGTGQLGRSSRVMIYPDPSVNGNFLMISANNASSGGSGGSSSVGGAGGTASTAWTYTNYVWAQLGQILSFPGQNGGTGNNSAASNITPVRSFTGGAGGGIVTAGGTTSAGGDISGVANGFFPTILGGPAGISGQAGFDGQNGFTGGIPGQSETMAGPLFCAGGSGGGASFASNLRAGRGGKGGFGCGGGGGGGANGASPGGLGGAGGDGGDGIVIITCY